ncbi:TonB-dependent receptor plug domain-containing protein [Gemmatimonadota bacterium]
MSYKSCLFFPILCFILSVALPATAQQPEPEETPTILVTATKNQASIHSLSTSATVITREDIQRKGHMNVAEALRDIVGFDIVHSGGPGSISYPQMRGTVGKFTVVLIDGVRVNDPADANGGVGSIFSHLTTADIERIEVVRGSQSPLYGSSAAAGVINIITRTGGKDSELRVSYEGGALNSNRTNFGYSLVRNGFKFRADQGITATDGIIHRETYRNYTTSVKVGYESTGKFDWETLVRFTRMKSNFAEFKENYDHDYGGEYWSAQLADPNQQNKFDYTIIGNRFRHQITNSWHHELNFGVNVRDRNTIDPNDGNLGTMTAPYDNFSLDWINFYNTGEPVPVPDTPYNPEGRDYSYTGINYDLDYRHTFMLSGDNVSDILTTGFEYLYQDYDQKGSYGVLSENIYTASVYAHNQVLFLEDALSLNTGIRFDSQDETDASTTGMFGMAYDVREAGLILRANLGSAFRAPSMFELYSTSGNLNLGPEKSLSYEFGVEKYTMQKKLRMSIGYWFTEIDDMINFVVTDPVMGKGNYLNYDKAKTKGLEAQVQVIPHRNWRIGLNYTYTDSRKKNGGEEHWSRNVQLPYNKLNLNLTYARKRASVSVDGYWVDDSRLRWNGIDRMGSYLKLDLAGRVPLHKSFTVTLRLLNLLDEDYFEGMGYKEAGIGAHAGVEMNY